MDTRRGFIGRVLGLAAVAAGFKVAAPTVPAIVQNRRLTFPEYYALVADPRVKMIYKCHIEGGDDQDVQIQVGPTKNHTTVHSCIFICSPTV